MTAHVPPGARQATALAQAAQQTRRLLDVVFHDLTLSLDVAIRNGLVAVLIFSVITLLAAFFLRDISPRQQPQGDGDAEAGADARPAGELAR